MAYSSRVVKHSISPIGLEIVTMELTYPVVIHQEVWTHRTLWKTTDQQHDQWVDAGRSSSSNRAIPTQTIIDAVRSDPFVPRTFRRRTRTMAPGGPLNDRDQAEAKRIWLEGKDSALMTAILLATLGVHKQWANRPLAPYQWITTVATANREWWDHFFGLRVHEAAQEEIREIATLAQHDLVSSIPDELALGDWHTPYVDFFEQMDLWEADSQLHNDPWYRAKRLSAARCARTSYLRQNEVHEMRDDLKLYDDLVSSRPPHESPREHVCTPLESRNDLCGPYAGWAPLRQVESVGG